MTAQTISVANIPYVISVSSVNNAPVYSTLGIGAIAQASRCR